MSYTHPAWVELRRRRWLRNDAHLWVRHDSYRFAPPGALDRELRAAKAKAAGRREAEAAAVAEQEAFELELLELRWEFKKLKLEYELRRVQKKYSPDQPRVPAGSREGGQWTGSGSGTSTDVSAARRGGRRGPETLSQQTRLDLATARAQEAVSRIQQLDPNWRPTPSFTSRDTTEGMIRAKEAEAREADARFLALSRAGQDAPYAMRDPPTTAEVLMPGGTMVGYRVLGAPPSVRTATPAEFESVRTELMGGARRIEPDADYNGVWYQRQNGSVFGLRLSSDYGLTLDVIRSDHPLIPNGFRIHQR